MTSSGTPRSGSPTPIGEILNRESRAAPCPRCGGESVETRYPTRPFVAQKCRTCVAQIEAERAQLDAEREQRELAERRTAATQALAVPPRYVDVSLDTFDVGTSADLERAIAFARRFVATWPDVPAITVFGGGCGTGKGHLAWSIAKELASTRAVRGRVVVLSDAIRDLRDAWNSAGDGPTEAERLSKYRAADLLVIDEISRHAFYGQPQQHLYDLVAWREVQLRPTILTTNEVWEDLSTVLGPALSSRARGAGGYVEFGTDDWRIANAARNRMRIA